MRSVLLMRILLNACTFVVFVPLVVICHSWSFVVSVGVSYQLISGLPSSSFSLSRFCCVTASESHDVSASQDTFFYFAALIGPIVFSFAYSCYSTNQKVKFNLEGSYNVARPD